MKDAFQGYQTLVCSRLARIQPKAMLYLLYCSINMDMLYAFTVFAFQVVMGLHLLCHARRKAMLCTIVVDIYIYIYDSYFAFFSTFSIIVGINAVYGYYP